ncbi:protein inscuteable homolog [Anoplophora glabripennis]|uniref:protein inscuteable homolog n=1 Tax=Anoplophora glabripennis TaxID=217634 RepID=UPI000C78743D|nr:protein inscuteable homolog [Anoplophora glabripennis]
MSGFKRSPSKVWWGNDSLEWREISASPGSQDSGFSDTETSPHLHANNNKNSSDTPKKSSPAQRIPKDIFKELTSEQAKENLSTNYKEKTTPEKVKITQERLVKSEVKATPKKTQDPAPSNTVPARKHRFTKNSPKVSRNLFNSKQKECKNAIEAHQYSREHARETTHSTFLNTSEEDAVDDSYSWRSSNTVDESFENVRVRTLPLISAGKVPVELDTSAPAVLGNFKEDEYGAGFSNSLSSDCESELECLFNGADSPKHTSTPKAGPGTKMCQRRDKLSLNLCLKYHQERVPPIPSNGIDVDNKAVQRWMDEARQNYEQECMTTLQCKSIAGELNQKVSHLASCLTTTLRGILSHARCIEMEYKKLNSEKKHIEPLVQSLVGNILDFLNTNTRDISPNMLKLCDDIRLAKSDESLKVVPTLYAEWENVYQEILVREVKRMMDKLENPTSELDLRATVTGITSLALRNEELIEMFTKADVIPILLILCEKCEGSSMRSLILRALSTMCCNSSAVRQLEKFSGVQIIAETLEEDSRPEPERSEAVALLAQVTAPWLEDNHCVKGLQDYSRKLVKSLTKFAAVTKCCQNLLLCAAALANLSTMDPKSIKHMIHAKTAKVMLEGVKIKGPRASIYLLEQVATLIANMSAIDLARKQLTNIKASGVLLCFLKTNFVGEDVERRLQQKSIIALSRLCGQKEAATQVVELGGVERLVKMCREKNERHDSDAVLVAALATLRKIADACGADVLSAQDAQELVEPKLLDSFLAYSTQNESYV